MASISSKLPTEAQVTKFEMLQSMLSSTLVEMREFAKKKQDGVLNPMKVALLNRILADIKSVLSDEPSVAYLDLLDDEMLPQNSDAVLILGQYNAAMHRFKAQHHSYDPSILEDRWFTQENPRR